MSDFKNVLFVCIENSCRSQIAEAFGHMHGEGVIHVHSSGSKPSGVINEKAIASMKDVGYDLTVHLSKSLNDVPNITYDYVVTMGCGDQCQNINAIYHEDWNIPDPKNMEMNEFNDVRDIIKENVIRLIGKIKTNNI